MPLYKFNEKILLFIHIPKTGGTTIEKTLRTAGKEAFFNHKVPNELICTPQHLQAEALSELVPESFVDLSFTVTRHPIDRFVSEFFYRHQYFNSSKVRLSRFSKRKNMARLSDQEISRYFSKWTKKAFDEVTKDPYKFDNHFRPQSEFVSYPNTEIYKFEDGLQSTINDIGCKLNVSFPEVSHEMASHRRAIKIEPKTCDLIREFYRNDFEKFDYK